MLDAGALHVAFETGVDAPGLLDDRWSPLGNYSFHYAEPGLDFRFDRHPNPHSATAHVPLPPDTTATAPSCITVAQPERVALAVVERWRAVPAFGPGAVNDGENPP